MLWKNSTIPNRPTGAGVDQHWPEKQETGVRKALAQEFGVSACELDSAVRQYG
jgi:hypothetical protein